MSTSVLNLIEGLIGGVLALDEESASRLHALHGKVLAIEVLGTTLKVHVCCTGAGLRLVQTGTGQPDVTISGTPLELLAQLAPARSAGARGSLLIAGDVELAQEFQRIFRNVDPDWEEALAGWLGDSAAHRFGNLLREARSVARESRSSLALDLGEYLRYEKDLLPDRIDVVRFVVDVDRLRDDAERLKARLERITIALPTVN